MVLWLVGMLAVIAAGFASSTRTHIRITANTVENARAEALADAGIAIATIDIVRGRALRGRERRFALDGTPVACRLEDSRLTIAVEDEGGKVDLNAADARLLTMLLAALGLAAPDAAAAALAIDAFRGGAGQGAAFAVIEDVDRVPGLTASVPLEKLRPWVTVHSRQNGLDETVAPSGLAAALAAAAGVGAASRLSRPTGGALPPQLATPSRQSAFTIRAEARLASGAIFVREATVELAATRTASTILRRWRRGSMPVTVGGPEAADTLRPC